MSSKAVVVKTTFSRLMTNIGGPTQKWREVRSSDVITPVLIVMTYGIAIWAGALKSNASRRKVSPVDQRSALRFANAYHLRGRVCHRQDAADRRTIRRTEKNLPAKRTNHQGQLSLENERDGIATTDGSCSPRRVSPRRAEVQEEQTVERKKAVTLAI